MTTLFGILLFLTLLFGGLAFMAWLADRLSEWFPDVE